MRSVALRAFGQDIRPERYRIMPHSVPYICAGTKGDNNNITDGKVRFSDIDSVLVALIY